MSRGRRYDPEQKLNLKKVFAVVIAILVIIMFFVAIKTILKKDKDLHTEIQPIINYYSAYTNEKWGVIDSNGNYVIQPIYDEMVVVPNKLEPVFLCVYDVDYTTGEYKTKVIDKNNNQLFMEYDNVEPIENFDSNGVMWYEENVLRVEKDGKYGIIDFSGNIIMDCECDNLYALKGYSKKLVTVKEDLYGLVDTSGNIIVYNECNSDEEIIEKCLQDGYSLEKTSVKVEEKSSNIGDWYISGDKNSSYYIQK